MVRLVQTIGQFGGQISPKIIDLSNVIAYWTTWKPPQTHATGVLLANLPVVDVKNPKKLPGASMFVPAPTKSAGAVPDLSAMVAASSARSPADVMAHMQALLATVQSQQPSPAASMKVAKSSPMAMKQMAMKKPPLKGSDWLMLSEDDLSENRTDRSGQAGADNWAIWSTNFAVQIRDAAPPPLDRAAGHAGGL